MPSNSFVQHSNSDLMPAKILLSAACIGALTLGVDAGFTGIGGAAPKRGAKPVKKAAKKPVARKPVARKPVAKKAPVKKAVVRSAGGFSPASDIGVTPPLGLFDPLNLLARGPEVYRRSQELEIKHGRLAMAATLGVIVTEARRPPAARPRQLAAGRLPLPLARTRRPAPR